MGIAADAGAVGTTVGADAADPAVALAGAGLAVAGAAGIFVSNLIPLVATSVRTWFRIDALVSAVLCNVLRVISAVRTCLS